MCVCSVCVCVRVCVNPAEQGHGSALSPELSESGAVCQQTHPAGSALRQAYHSPLIIAGTATLFIINVVPQPPIRSEGTGKEKHTAVLSQARSRSFSALVYFLDVEREPQRLQQPRCSLMLMWCWVMGFWGLLRATNEKSGLNLEMEVDGTSSAAPLLPGIALRVKGEVDPI